MKSIRQRIMALSVSCALVVSLAGCGVSVTGVALDLPDSMERVRPSPPRRSILLMVKRRKAPLLPKAGHAGHELHFQRPRRFGGGRKRQYGGCQRGHGRGCAVEQRRQITASKTIEVVVTPTGITTTDKLTLTAGEVVTLETAVAPDDATHVSINYTSSDDAVATVSDAGEVTAVAAGDATVTVAVDGTALSADCKVTVLPAIESVELNYTTLSLRPEGTAQLTYIVAPEEALADTVTYASSDESVATVNADGNVTAVADGTATITVEVNGVTAECEVTVSTKATSTSNATSNNNGAASSNSGSTSDGGQAQSSAPATSSSFEYGALPMDPATDGETWWNIDSSDSAYWAVANNINAMRAEGGLPALTVSSSLSSIAHDRCVYLIANDVFLMMVQQLRKSCALVQQVRLQRVRVGKQPRSLCKHYDPRLHPNGHCLHL